MCEVELSLNGTLREIFSFGEGRAAFDRFLPSMCVMAEAQRYRPLWAYKPSSNLENHMTVCMEYPAKRPYEDEPENAAGRGQEHHTERTA